MNSSNFKSYKSRTSESSFSDELSCNNGKIESGLKVLDEFYKPKDLTKTDMTNQFDNQTDLVLVDEIVESEGLNNKTNIIDHSTLVNEVSN